MAQVEFQCKGTCAEYATQFKWVIDGRFNAEGEFEPEDETLVLCPNCELEGEPVEDDVRLANN